ncbi:rpsU-divergently transcribed protein [Thalassovita gelatinovora]|uniref:RpsU-divergently transcribed protein n=1 Tax=Thalassovita gelatinovora TaxID=53501 RepID=A0A0N7LVF8_THAGE|nr:COQ9 family protein [Thalassovita gelatinovora]QIZ81404.1 COQ9 family protein [Thalassovita gelatinovora]CUH66178.1 rpsU-divergently transcribed protein [Thalassovita gelatinovora]SEQ21266.1 ubiquinone biosynthesis protein COQ9 [Thalassovita gelatinovora]
MTVPDLKDRLLDAALIHVAFDGWTEATFAAAVADEGIDPAVARALCPRGAVDLAVAFHKRGDAQMAARLATADLAEMRFRDRIALGVRYRLEAVEDKEAVRRGLTLFSMPQHAPDGMRLMWETAGLIWDTLGDSSTDVNWYTKRATLSAVYGSCVLYWLGDETPDCQATWEFLDRRIDDVMKFEKTKAGIRDNKLLSGVLAGPMAVLDQIKAPGMGRQDMPGRWPGKK